MLATVRGRLPFAGKRYVFLVTNQQRKKVKNFRGFSMGGYRKSGSGRWLLIIGLITAGAYYFISDKPEIWGVTTESSAPTECTSDWKKCKNNTDLIEHYNGMPHIKAMCKMAALKLAQYGDPQFPWAIFGNYREGSDYISDGQVIIYEPGARYQNAYGAMEHVGVMCDFDLKTDEVRKAYLHTVN